MTQEVDPQLATPSLPDVYEGQEVWALCAGGHSVRRIVRRAPFFVAVVPLSTVEDWSLNRERAASVDWPAQDVVPGDQPPPWPELGAVHEA